MMRLGVSDLPGGSLVRGGFEGLARLRRGRGFHPHGIRLYGSLRVSPDGPLAEAGDGSDVTVRLSKGLGLPGRLPDVLGVSVRATGPGPSWDLTFASAGRGRLGRMAFRPANSWGGTTFSSLAPYRTPDGLWWLLATLDTPIPGDRPDIEPVRALVEGGGTLHLVVRAVDAGGQARPAARITLDRVDDDAAQPAFDPMTDPPPGLRLSPQWLSRIRERAYQGSRAGRDGA